MPDDSGQESDRPLAHVVSRRQVRERLLEIKAYIDQQRGNDPDDQTGWKVLERIFHDLFYLRRWPYIGQQIQGMSEHYRKRRVGDRHILYYFVDEEHNVIYLIDLRHGSQKPLKPSTIKKYKSEIPQE
jgi:hypothetical protein